MMWVVSGSNDVSSKNEVAVSVIGVLAALQAGAQPVSQAPTPVASRAAAGGDATLRLFVSGT